MNTVEGCWSPTTNAKLLQNKDWMQYKKMSCSQNNYRARYQEDEQNIQQVKDLDEQILKNVVAHAAVSIHLLEDQLCLSRALIEAVRNQAAKYEINICFLEPSYFEGIVAESQAWKKFINDQASPSS